MLKLSRTEDIGALVRDRRRVLRLSQSELAQKLGTSQDWVSRLESGKPTLHVGLILRALHELGVVLTVEPTAAKPAPKPQSKRPPISIKDIVDG